MNENDLNQVLMDGIKEILFIMKVGDDSEFYYDFVNRAAIEKTKLSKDVIGKPIRQLYTEEVATVLYEKYLKVVTTLETVIYQDSFKTRKGDVCFSETTLTPIFDSKGEKCSYVVASVQDITAKIRNKHLGVIANDSQDLIKVIDEKGIIIDASPSHKNILGYDREEYIGESFLKQIHPDDTRRFKEIMLYSLNNYESLKIEIRKKHVLQGWIWFEYKATPVFDDNNKFLYMICLASNIQTHKDYESKLKHFAYYDSLTNLPNRRYLKKRLAHALEDYRQGNINMLAVAILDIDFFKSVNDNYGHDTGDAVIVEYGNRIKSSIRDIDLVARLGGDEFVVLLPNIGNVENLNRAADKIQNAMHKPWIINGMKLNITTSMGITVVLDKNESISNVLKNADIALYKAKNTGKDGYYI